MKPPAPPARGRRLAIAMGVAVALGYGAHAWMDRATAPEEASDTVPAPLAAPITPPVGPGTAPAAGASPTPGGAQLPPTLPSGIVLVSTVPDAQPPQATLLVEGRLQSQPLGSSIAATGLQVREVTAEGITLGLQDRPPQYTLRVTSATEATRLMAEARAQRMAERQPTLVQPVGDPVVQQDADRSGARPDEMKVTVHRRQPVTRGPVGSF